MGAKILDDRELLEMAAKAAGYTIADWRDTYSGMRPALHDTHAPGRWLWDPLADDGDALRLAVKLNITICRPVSGDNVVHWGTYAMPEDQSDGPKVLDGDDPFAATRRAIVRAAAAIGAAHNIQGKA